MRVTSYHSNWEGRTVRLKKLGQIIYAIPTDSCPLNNFDKILNYSWLHCSMTDHCVCNIITQVTSYHSIWDQWKDCRIEAAIPTDSPL